MHLTFRITNCRFPIVFHTLGLVCLNLSLASRDFVCVRSTASAQITSISHFALEVFGVETAFQRVELCIASARTTLAVYYGAPFVKILYLSDLAQKLLSLHISSYLRTEITISARI